MLITTKPVESSNIAAVGYHVLSSTLEVHFRNGTIYRYAGVPDTVYEAALTAVSIGSFLSREVFKQPYPFTKYPTDALENLRTNQQQLDQDGVTVGVSRQALEEVLAWL